MSRCSDVGTRARRWRVLNPDSPEDEIRRAAANDGRTAAVKPHLHFTLLSVVDVRASPHHMLIVEANIIVDELRMRN